MLTMKKISFQFLSSLSDVDFTKLDKLSGNVCNDWIPLLTNLITEIDDPSDITYQTIYFIRNLCILHFDHSDKSNPYKPALRLITGTTSFDDAFIPDDKIDALKTLGGMLPFNDLKARIFDIIWLHDKSRHMVGKKAVEHYLKVVDEIFDSINTKQSGVRISKRIDRVLTLSWQLSGNVNREPFLSTVEFTINLVEKYGERMKEYGSVENANHILHIIGSSIPHKTVDVDKFTELLRFIVDSMDQTDDFDRLKWNGKERALLLLIKIENRFGDKDIALEEKKLLAEHYAFRGSSEEKSNNHGVAASWYKTAFETTREIRDYKEEGRIFHKKMLENQKLSTHEGAIIQSAPIKLTPEIHEMYNNMQGKEKRDMLITMIMYFGLIRKKDAEIYAERRMTSSVVRQVFPIELQNEDGHIITTATTEEEKQALSLGEHARIFIPIRVQILLTALNVFIGSHTITEMDIMGLLKNNYFVKPSQIVNYRKALKYGFELKFYEATYLLIPLIENSIRWVLYLNGEITTKYEEKIQQEYLLNSLLDQKHIDINKYFEEDMIHTFRMLFVDKFGFNLRNRAMHGLDPNSNLSKYEYIYTWFLGLFMVFIGYDIFKTGKAIFRFNQNDEEKKIDTNEVTEKQQTDK